MAFASAAERLAAAVVNAWVGFHSKIDCGSGQDRAQQCLQLELLEAAEVTAQEAVTAAKKETEDVKQSVVNLHQDNERCQEAVAAVTARRQVISMFAFLSHV